MGMQNLKQVSPLKKLNFEKKWILPKKKKEGAQIAENFACQSKKRDFFQESITGFEQKLDVRS